MANKCSTYIPSGHYVSKTEAAKFLNVSVSKLQYHIGKNNIKTINFPGLGHLISERDIKEFKKKLEDIRPGRPTIYNMVW